MTDEQQPSRVGARSWLRRTALVVTVTLGLVATLLATPLFEQQVVLSASVAEAQLARCVLDSRLDNDCLEETIATQVRSSDPETLIETFAAQSRIEGSWIRSYCHPTAHALGAAVYDKVGDADAAMAIGADFCDWGYYHGVMKRMSDFAASTADAVDRAVVLCEAMKATPTSSLSSYVESSCYHGIGHMLASKLDFDIMKGEKFCGPLGGNNSELCTFGLVMDWFDFINAQPDTSTWPVGTDRTDPRLTCLKLTIAQVACAVSMTHLSVPGTNIVDSIESSAALCSQFTDARVRLWCANGVGQVLNDTSERNYSPDRIRAICSPASFTGAETLMCVSTYLEGRISTSSHTPLPREDIPALCTALERSLSASGVPAGGLCPQAELCYERLMADPVHSWCGTARIDWVRVVPGL